jgi:hypothetical protein
MGEGPEVWWEFLDWSFLRGGFACEVSTGVLLVEAGRAAGELELLLGFLGGCWVVWSCK